MNKKKDSEMQIINRKRKQNKSNYSGKVQRKEKWNEIKTNTHKNILRVETKINKCWGISKS